MFNFHFKADLTQRNEMHQFVYVLLYWHSYFKNLRTQLWEFS